MEHCVIEPGQLKADYSKARVMHHFEAGILLILDTKLILQIANAIMPKGIALPDQFPV